MPEKLMTLTELSEYLQIKEEVLALLVEKKIIAAYKLGGELLRFRKDQIDAIRGEIESRISDGDRFQISETRKKVKERYGVSGNRGSIWDRLLDFFYFNDFYIVSCVIILLLLAFIYSG